MPTDRQSLVDAQYGRDFNDYDWRERLLERAIQMAVDGYVKKSIHGWWLQYKAKHIFWLISMGRTGEAHALLMNAGY